MRVARSPAFLEAIANHPSVFSAIASKGKGPFCLGPVWHECIGFEFDTGGWVAHQASPGVYDLHTLFLPKSVNVREKAAQVLRYLFDHGATLIIGRIPADLPHARRLARDMGLTYSHDLPHVISRDGRDVPYQEFQLTREAWVSHQTELENGS